MQSFLHEYITKFKYERPLLKKINTLGTTDKDLIKKLKDYFKKEELTFPVDYTHIDMLLHHTDGIYQITGTPSNYYILDKNKILQNNI